MPDLPINTFVLDQDTRDIIERERDLARWYYAEKQREEDLRLSSLADTHRRIQELVRRTNEEA